MAEAARPVRCIVKLVEISVAAHDTTGGMETKILEATAIARLGVDVYITKVDREHSLRALKGDVNTSSARVIGLELLYARPNRFLTAKVSSVFDSQHFSRL